MSDVSAAIPRYKCHKEVHALKIEKVFDSFAPAAEGGAKTGGVLAVESPYASIDVTIEWMQKHEPVAGGYYVVYDDGYTSFSPAEAFESGYTRIE